VESISFRTISANKATVEKGWVVVDAESQILGRLASQVARIIRGKHKANYTPHVDCGDRVIVINADKIRLSGKNGRISSTSDTRDIPEGSEYPHPGNSKPNRPR
jgi:large subunit ribosomal protein L13